MKKRGVEAQIIKLKGGVEISIKPGVADVIDEIAAKLPREAAILRI